MKGTGYFSNHWHGEQPLWQSFWINGQLLGIVPMGLFFAVLQPSAGRGDVLMDAVPRLAGLAILAFGIIYQIWLYVGLWRSATAHSIKFPNRLWGPIAKIFVVLPIIFYSSVAFVAISDNSQLKQASTTAIKSTSAAKSHNQNTSNALDTVCDGLLTPHPEDQLKFTGIEHEDGGGLFVKYLCARQSTIVAHFVIIYQTPQKLKNGISFNQYEQVTVFECLGRRYRVVAGDWFDMTTKTRVHHFRQDGTWIEPKTLTQHQRMNVVCD